LMPRGSSIVLNGSIAGIKGFADFSVYNATKAAVRSFARSWTTEFKDRGIRVNVVSPAPVTTPAIDKINNGDPASIEQFKSNMVSSIPLGRWGEADEIAKSVVFLASDDSSFVAGAELFVDGGMAQV